MRPGIFAAFVVLGLVALPFMDAGGGAFAVTSGLVTGAAIPLIDSVMQNRRWLKLVWFSLVYRRQSIRLSISYLYRIKIDGLYLLTQGKRFNTYIPVGGVYKYAESARQHLDHLGILTDDLVPVDESSKNDLRIRVPGKNLVAFFRWFESGESRETSPWREFWEELVDEGLVSAHAFPWIFERKVRRHVTPIRYSKIAQSREIFVADIYELDATTEQAKELERLRNGANPSILWVDANQIRRRGVVPGKKQEYEIGEPAEWVL
ncbi:hypothetical protein [Micromonospora sp. RTP1Z1]|uniref:SMODS-associated NUDIX domain-containing protein n=1 Tax=Micromonospora sp. RTP1Z1 TaxID=2994043 RepID=UPI0029C8D4FE|nr:hypothetical protein [Micromonospora sp. RTP1Z1]